MLPNVPTEFRIRFQNTVYCPCCSIQITNDNATLQNGWWVCLQCAFSRNTEDPIFLKATEFVLIGKHVTIMRNTRAYTPRPPIYRSIPIVELVTLETIYGCNQPGQLVD